MNHNIAGTEMCYKLDQQRNLLYYKVLYVYFLW